MRAMAVKISTRPAIESIAEAPGAKARASCVAASGNHRHPIAVIAKLASAASLRHKLWLEDHVSLHRVKYVIQKKVGSIILEGGGMKLALKVGVLLTFLLALLPTLTRAQPSDPKGKLV